MNLHPLATTLIASLALGAGALAQAQVAGFPVRALKIVVPTSPGSGSDTTARFFGEQLGAALGQPVLIENKPGGNGVIAAMAVKQAPADGYTIFLGTDTAGFHLSAEWFASTSGTKFVNVPYKGAPEVFTALMGNQLDWAVSDLIAAMPQVKGGKLRGIAVSGDKRHADYPDIPTIKESGYPDYVNYTWITMYIRSETPEPVTSRLVEAMQKIPATPAAREFIAKIGSEPMALAPAEMRKFQISETERFRLVAQSAGIKPQ